MQEQKLTMENILFLQQKMRCKGNNKCQWFCSQQKCKESSLTCLNEQCICQKQNHNKCQLFQKASKVIKKLYQKSVDININKYIRQIQKIFNNIIDKISQKRQQMINEIKYFLLSDIQKKILMNLDEQKFSDLLGQDLFLSKTQKQLFQNAFNQKIEVEKLQKINQKYLSQLLKQTSALIKQLKPLIGVKKMKLSKSKVVVNLDQDKFICSSFDKKIKSYELIFRASQNNFQSKKFHEKCNEVQNTLILIQTEYGKKIAGYTPLPWANKGNPLDQKLQSFILSISQRQKYKLRDPKKPILLYQSHGPTFGESYSDIYISDKANNQKCNFNIGKSYGPQLEQNQKIKRIENFCGNKTYKATVKQYQVYKINFIQ